MIWTIIRAPGKFQCSCCSSPRVSATKTGIRHIKGLPSGCLKVLFEVIMHRLKCLSCGAFQMEKLNFIPHQKCHYTKKLAENVLRLRSEMTITAVANYMGLHWNTVKDIEKSYLKKKYSSISLHNVTAIGIDEVYVGKDTFFTIVRDMNRGDVLFVGEGKSGETLAPFAKRIKRIKHRIMTIAMDLGNPFTAWAKAHLPKAIIVYDKFHVIQLMNNKVNAVRRRTMNKLVEEEKKALKGHMYTLLKNEEDLDENATEALSVIRNTFHDLGEISLMKECLRNVYIIAEFEEHARLAFMRWVSLAIETGVPELKTMAKTIKGKLDGVVAYWKGKLTSASMEGFNNKIGWLNRQAYGYRDMEYFKLKIYDLPKTRTEKKL
ncbi:MAG: ISL3 family transposase [Bacteroidales bacterium]|nr:ISL3 family transposase [Bacteroidales bacterium]